MYHRHPQVLSLMVWSAPTSNVTRFSGAMTIGSWNHSSKYWTAVGFGTLQYLMFCSTITCSLYYNGWLVLIGIWGSGGWTGLYVTCPCSWPGPDWGLRYHVVWCTPWETGLRDNCDWCCIHKHWASWSQGMPIQLFVNNPPTHPLICSFVVLKLQEHMMLTCFDNKLRELEHVSKKQAVESCCKPWEAVWLDSRWECIHFASCHFKPTVNGE